MPQHPVLGGGIVQMSETPTSLYHALWGIVALSTQLSRLITNHLIFALGRIRTYMRSLRGLAELTVPSSLQEHVKYNIFQQTSEDLLLFCSEARNRTSANTHSAHLHITSDEICS